MTENTAPATELTSQYIAQVTADLEGNLKEQERIGTEIAALQEQLVALQHDHTVLVHMQQALGIAANPARPGAEPAAASVPSPRRARKESAESSSDHRPGAGKSNRRTSGARKPRARTSDAGKAGTAQERGGTGTKPAGGKRAPRAAAARPARPTLVELVRRHLSEQSEPRSAAEVAAALGQTHPDRSVKTTVVRTTLEGLVARTQAQRTKQGTSVFYTAPDTAGAPAQAQAQGDPQTEEADG
ncbi:hypothetical protein [Streptomyces sp. NPDC046197]|uniref:hypothetical protein n=1 Tax=Streptomyces sp. NPDC046197 TaxID=3154337 RepID=UPI0033D15A79